MAAGPPSLYDLFGVQPTADAATLRAAYRQRARQVHPDVTGGDGAPMAALNAAWAVLSDPSRRRAYDATLGPAAAPRTSSPHPGPPADAERARRGAGSRAGSRPDPGGRSRPGRGEGADVRLAPGWRRAHWIASVQLQIRRLGGQAARSAVQALAVRHPGVPRAVYETMAEPILGHLLVDTEERVRSARAAGAAPLDLANGAALLGLRSYADRFVAEAVRRPRDGRSADAARLIDRMWDTMAHEIPRQLEMALGGNPRASRRLR